MYHDFFILFQEKRARFPRARIHVDFRSYLDWILDWFSHSWLATVQEVLQADWQEAWHSPQPPFAQDSFRLALLMVLICSMIDILLCFL